MDAENDQFEQVRRLLALKKYEQPPPGYFNNFSTKVIARLQALETARPATWLQRLGLDLDFRPAMMGAFGVVVCGLLLVAVFTSMGSSQPSPNRFAVAGDPSAFFAAPNQEPSFAANALNPIINPEEIPSSLVPVSGDSSNGSPFGQLMPQAERAAFRLGN